MVDFNLRALAKDKVEIREIPTEDIATDKHLNMLKVIAPYAKQTEQKNVTPVYIDYKTRNTKLALVLCPQWAPQFPPFNLARLSGVAKAAGYETHIFDINIKTYNMIKNTGKIVDFWNSANIWKWINDQYMIHIHDSIVHVLQEAVDDIVKLNPTAIGFTMYDVSEEASKWMILEIKKKLPDVKILVGGSNVQKSWFRREPFYDYIVNGEGEGALLKILNEIENNITYETQQFISQPESQRLNLNGFPLPDYESIDFSLYEIPNGVNTEISRGCTAKCTFCEETHFWKYRQRKAVDLIEEVEWLYYNKGTDVFWFIDSLVNGNINELRAFCKAVEAKGLKINWTGYARCDGRMDLEYFKDLKAGGCIMLNYGIESGSQKVLDSMDKKVTIAEMEANFRDGKTVGIYNATNLILGFPTEGFQEFYETMIFMWRNRNMNVNNVGVGVGFGLSAESIVGQNPERFNLLDHKYQGHWITRDFSMGGTHVMTRVKSFSILMDFMKGCTETHVAWPIRYALARDHYKITLDDPNVINEIEYEIFDYNIIKIDINPFANTLVNEIWPLFRMLWKIRGGYTAQIKFSPEIDLKEFGTCFGPGMYNAIFNFKINKEGYWEADFNYKFEQVKDPNDDRVPTPDRTHGAFYAQEYSRIQSNTAIRARRLAKPVWNLETGRTDDEFRVLLDEEEELNKTIDFSFQYHYTGTGKW